jgi:hypothetical protein
MKIYTTVKPLFAAQGRSEEHGKVIFLFSNYEAAQAKAKELIHMHYDKVSAYRVGE